MMRNQAFIFLCKYKLQFFPEITCRSQLIKDKFKNFKSECLREVDILSRSLKI